MAAWSMRSGVLSINNPLARCLPPVNNNWIALCVGATLVDVLPRGHEEGMVALSTSFDFGFWILDLDLDSSHI
jgi:hypothetical protein